MMIILRDDPVIEIFDSPRHPPDWIETIDIKNNEYRFCDDEGQRYVGVIIQPRSGVRVPPALCDYELHPVGTPDVANAIALVDQAEAIEPNQDFPDLAALRSYLLNRHNKT